MAVGAFHPEARRMGFVREFDIVEGNRTSLNPHMARRGAGDVRPELLRFMILVHGCQSLFGLVVRKR